MARTGAWNTPRRPLGNTRFGGSSPPALRTNIPGSPTLQAPHPVERASDTPRAGPDFRVAIDFGTTYTCVAFNKPNSKSDTTLIIKSFPNDPLPGKSPQVPTESYYLVPRTEHSSEAIHQSVPDLHAIRRFRLRSSGRTHTAKEQTRMRAAQDGPDPTEYKFGYEAHEFDKLPNDTKCSDYEFFTAVSRMKLLFDKSIHSEDTRAELQDALQKLREGGFIDRDEDVITDALATILSHCKKYLERGHRFHTQSSVELTLCVPVCWDTKANVIMTKCLKKAMTRAKFGTSNDSSLFMVNEAEAAAVYMLSSGLHEVEFGDCILLLECGGGTTDMAVYGIGEVSPIRLSTEYTKPVGASIGSTDLNTRMRQFAIRHLESEQYLCSPEFGVTIETIVDQEIMKDFELSSKRSFSIYNSMKQFRWNLRGLKKSATDPRLENGSFVLSHDDMFDIFEPSLRLIAELVEDQIRQVHQRAIKLNKLVLVGGYGDSPALQESLQILLDALNQELMTDISLVSRPEDIGAVGVAEGALMRANDKSYGPERIPHISYGVLRHIAHEPNTGHAWMSQRSRVNSLDGVGEIRNTIRWVIKAGEGPLKQEHRVAFESSHCFTPDQTEWIAEEILLVSETCTEDFYRQTHWKNKGKHQELGKITFSLTHLQDRIPITNSERPGKQYYEVTVLVEMVVIDRDLKFFVRWPVEDGEVLKASQDTFCMVAAFEPGTE